MTQYTKLSPRKDVVVFAGDRRLSDRTGFTDNNSKATPLGRFAVGGALGDTRTLHPTTKVVQRDVHLALCEFFAEREVTSTTIGELASSLKAKHDEYVAQHRGGVHIDHHGKYFSIVISSLQDGRVIDYQCKFSLEGPDGLAPADPRQFLCKTGALIISGEEDVRTALYSLNHASFKEIYGRPEILHLVSNPMNCPFETVTVDQAVEICRFVNRVCSEQMQAITGRVSTISPECDVYILDKDGVHPA